MKEETFQNFLSSLMIFLLSTIVFELISFNSEYFIRIVGNGIFILSVIALYLFFASVIVAILGGIEALNLSTLFSLGGSLFLIDLFAHQIGFANFSLIVFSLVTLFYFYCKPKNRNSKV